MAQWIVGYVAGTYTSMTAIPLLTPGSIRRIVGGFYIANGVVPVALTPVQTADANDEVQIYNRTNCKIYRTGLSNVLVFLFCEIELGVGEYVGTKLPITA